MVDWILELMDCNLHISISSSSEEVYNGLLKAGMSGEVCDILRGIFLTIEYNVICAKSVLHMAFAGMHLNTTPNRSTTLHRLIDLGLWYSAVLWARMQISSRLL